MVGGGEEIGVVAVVVVEMGVVVVCGGWGNDKDVAEADHAGHLGMEVAVGEGSVGRGGGPHGHGGRGGGGGSSGGGPRIEAEGEDVNVGMVSRGPPCGSGVVGGR